MFLVVIAFLTFVAVVMRYVFKVAFPGSFDIGRLLLGVAIFWGIAVATYRRRHICVDIAWQAMPKRMRRIVDIFADTAFAVFACLMAWAMFQQVARVRTTGQTTFELGIPLWPFYAVAWAGLVLCCLVLLMRVVAGLAGRDLEEEAGRTSHDV